MIFLLQQFFTFDFQHIVEGIASLFLKQYAHSFPTKIWKLIELLE